MIVKVGDRLRWKADGCVVEVRTVMHVEEDHCGMQVRHTPQICPKRPWDNHSIDETVGYSSEDYYFEFAEDPFVRFVREVLDAC